MASKSTLFKLFVLVAICCVVLIYLSNDGSSSYYEYLELQAFQNSPKQSPIADESMIPQGGLVDITDVGTTTDDNYVVMLNTFQQQMPNVPMQFWIENYSESMQKNYMCAKFPMLSRIQLYNKYWQTYNKANVSIQLYSAYFDRRESVDNGPVVRILAMANQIETEFPRTYCHIWFDNSTAPAIVPVTQYKLIWFKAWGNKPGIYYPYLLTCHLPKRQRHLIPEVVSLTPSACSQATNILKINYETPPPGEKKQQFGICVKGLNFPTTDLSDRLVEWLELMRILGAHKVHMYLQSVHPNMWRVLQYYQQKGYIELTPINSVPAEEEARRMKLPQLIYKRLNEVIPYNDCFYRNLYKYDYIAGVDIDEVIMPLGNLTSWSELMSAIQQSDASLQDKCPNGHSSVCFRNTYFPDVDNTAENEVKMHFLTHIMRVDEHSSKLRAVKCLHNTTEALTLHNHFSLAWLKSCSPLDTDTKLAQLQHYRVLPKGQKKDMRLVSDNNIWRFSKTLYTNTQAVLNELKYQTDKNTR